MRKCPSCGEPCADWRTECPGCGAAFVVRGTRKVPVIEEDRGELQQLVDALEHGRPAPPSAVRPSTRTVTVTRDVAVRTRRSGDAAQSSQAGVGCGRVVLALASVALVLLGIVYFPLQTLAACAVIFVLSGGYYFVVVVRR